MTTTDFTFTSLNVWLGVGSPPPAGWRPISTQSLLILVGVTGVGKSTTAAAMIQMGFPSALLPNRRVLTDDLIIAWLQAKDGNPRHPVTDRTARFDYTRRYRDRFPGGMAHALSQLWIDPASMPAAYLLFDGLRGENEVYQAAVLLPKACFIVLDAPHFVRIQRLLGRGDQFDQVSIANAPNQGNITDLVELGLASTEVESLFTPDQVETLLNSVRVGEVAAEDFQAKLRIVATERRNYDPAAAIAALKAVAPERTLIFDTTRFGPDQIAQQIVAEIA